MKNVKVGSKSRLVSYHVTVFKSTLRLISILCPEILGIAFAKPRVAKDFAEACLKVLRKLRRLHRSGPVAAGKPVFVEQIIICLQTSPSFSSKNVDFSRTKYYF